MRVKVRKCSGQWEMSNLFRSWNFSAFIDQKLAEKKCHSTTLTWMVLHRWKQKHQHFQAFFTNRSQTYTLCLLKNPRIEIFIANNSPKKFRPLKLWNKIDREPVIVFIQKSDKSDQWVPRKITFKEMKRRGMLGTGINRIIVLVLVRISFAPRA